MYAYGDSTCINTGEVKLVKNKKVSTRRHKHKHKYT